MSNVRRGPSTLLARIVRLLALLAWGGQLGIAVAPLIDAHAGPGAGPHVEADGLTRHYAHAPDQCWACAAHALVASPALPRVPVPMSAPAGGVAMAALPAPATRRLLAAARPRAPPVRESTC